MVELSYDQLISEFIDSCVEGENTIWRRAAIAYFLRVKLLAPAKAVSSDTGYSPRRINDLVVTFEAFPEETDRAKDLSFSHHMLAARTDDPVKWIELAIENGWSVRDMNRVIKGESPDADPIVPIKNIWKRVLTYLEIGDAGSDYLKDQIITTANQYE